MPWLTPINQPLTAAQAAHLLRRATSGSTPGQVKSFTGLMPAAAVTRLLADQPVPALPLDATTGDTYTDKPFVEASQGNHQNWLKGWWLNLMISEGTSVREKMVLFWQNHFVTTFAEVNDSRFMYRYNALLRQHALGNFSDFVIAVTKDPAMLRYLNGNQNTQGKANENYARELQELFTIGLGKGNYTEGDVKAAARVLTGWTDTGYRNTTIPTIGSTFRIAQHDTLDKAFSELYGSVLIKGRTTATAGDDEIADLIKMILAQPETARFIVRKLYIWFVNSEISADVETNFIEPLAKVFRDNQYQIKPVLTALFTSSHFYDEAIRGAMIKSPVELIVGCLRWFGVPSPDPVKDTTNFYTYTNYLLTRAREQQQNLMDQPTVFGWEAYYDTGYYQNWISANTLALRGYFTDQLVNGLIKVNGKTYTFDPVEIAKTLPDPSDAFKLVDDLTGQLFATALTNSQKDFLVDTVLLAGLPRYEWPADWIDAAQNNIAAKRTVVKMKLTNLFLYLLRMAEFQLL